MVSFFKSACHKMQVDLRQLRWYIVSPRVDKYEDRFQTVRERLTQAGIHNVWWVEGKMTGSASGGAFGFRQAFLHQVQTSSSEPFVIVEDDVQFTGQYPDLKVTVPLDSDLVFLGISVNGCQKNKYVFTPTVKRHPTSIQGVTQVFNMLTTHAMLFIQPRVLQDYIADMERSIRENLPWDTISSTRQEQYKVYALCKPIFYQDKTLGGAEQWTNVTFNDKDSTLDRKEQSQLARTGTIVYSQLG
jgi:hypothetical protein